MGQVPVFIVEDSQHMQVALRDLLHVTGPFEVVGVAQGETDATDWLHDHKWAWRVAIVDLLLPEGNGFSLVQRCRSESPDGKVIVFSEFASAGVKDRCLELGADAAFMKSEMTSFIGYLEQVAAAA
jgi:two-component system, OmpR family, response regulator